MSLPEAHNIQWDVHTAALLKADYARDDESLEALYAKAKAQQWDVARDIDWSYELNPDNPLGLPDETLLIFGSPLWQKLGAQERAVVRQHAQSWTVSQILHGEQAALLCSGRLALSEESMSAKFCAAVQAIDEARHVEAYSKLTESKLPHRYPVSSALRGLLEETTTQRQIDMVNLGMQILVEGIALSIFQSIVAFSRDPFIKDLVKRIQRDEARHFAVGRITLRRLYTEMSEAERREREEFVCEGALALYDHLCADDIWAPLGFDRKECGGMVRESIIANALRRSVFRRLVPSIRDIGLLTPKTIAVFTELKVIDYAAMPLYE